jgi:hypothetical protein
MLVLIKLLPTRNTGHQMKFLRLSSFLVACSIGLGMASSGCDRQTPQAKLDVSDVEHSTVKRQSIGNCWLYATASWAESLHLSATGEVANLSETYWTYWDWYSKIIGSSDKKIETGGSWELASIIIRKHGYMLEGEFIPTEAEEQMSEVQRSAEWAINEELSNGSLKVPSHRTAKNVKAALNAAFKVDIDALASKIHSAKELQTSREVNGKRFSLADEIDGGAHGWQSIWYPTIYGEGKTPDDRTAQLRKKALRRVLKAVNVKTPVIMSSMVEFAALNRENNATFEFDLYLKNGSSYGQGGHLIVLEDYVVDNVPNVGRIGEGDVSDELKEAALDGDVQYLVVKNSWGTNRPDRGLSDGYTRFEMKFLNLPLPFDIPHGESDISKGFWRSALSGFILPPEY